MNSHDIATLIKRGHLMRPMHHPVRLANEVVRPSLARDATEDEHNAIWAALTILANAMDGKGSSFAGVQDIHTCSGARAGLTADQVWALRDRMDTGTLRLAGFDEETQA